MSRIVLAMLGAVLFTGCGKRVSIPVAAPPPSIPSVVSKSGIVEHGELYDLGLAAFREFTPEGYRRAIGYFRRASDLAPGICDYRLHLAQANLFLAFEQASNLEDFTDTLSQSEPPACGVDTPFALRLEAFRSIGVFGLGRDRQEGVSRINAAIEREPQNALNWFVAWELGGNANQNSSPIFQPPEAASDLAIIQYYRGRYWLLRGDAAKARKSFENALELSPRHYLSYIGLAGAVSASDPDADVEPYYKKAVEIAPDFLLGRADLGDYYAWIAETALAEEQYRAALKQNSRYVPAYLGLGQAYLNAGMLDEAEQTLTAAIGVAPTAYEAYYYLGNVWLERENFDKAKEQYEAALKQVPVYPEALYALGTVFGEKREFDSALEQFEKVLRVTSRHAGAYSWRAAILADRKQFMESLADCNRALNLYDRQIADLAKSVDNAEKRGLLRRAAAERKKKEQAEATRERVREMKAEMEKELAAEPNR